MSVKLFVLLTGTLGNAQPFPRLALPVRVPRLRRGVRAQVPARQPWPRARQGAARLPRVRQGVPSEEDAGRPYEVSIVLRAGNTNNECFIYIW